LHNTTHTQREEVEKNKRRKKIKSWDSSKPNTQFFVLFYVPSLNLVRVYQRVPKKEVEKEEVFMMNKQGMFTIQNTLFIEKKILICWA
jgi:hypothetical protein